MQMLKEVETKERQLETHMSLRILLCHTTARASAGKYWFCVKKLLESWMC